MDSTGHGESHADQHGAADGGHHGEEHHGIHIFVEEFSRVEIPFIIALWIFCASLAKIGEISEPKNLSPNKALN